MFNICIKVYHLIYDELVLFLLIPLKKIIITKFSHLQTCMMIQGYMKNARKSKLNLGFNSKVHKRHYSACV